VHSLSGLGPKDAASGRSDHMNAKKPEPSQAAQQPKGMGIPKPAEQSQ